MKKLKQPIPILDDEPIDIQAVLLETSISCHRVEVRMKQDYFLNQTKRPIYGTFKDFFGVEKKCQIIYENPWKTDYYGFSHDIYHGFLTVDSYEEFENLKAKIKTYGDYIKICKADKIQKEIKIQEYVKKINSIEKIWK